MADQAIQDDRTIVSLVDEPEGCAEGRLNRLYEGNASGRGGVHSLYPGCTVRPQPHTALRGLGSAFAPMRPQERSS
jgi:hypothetical protein